MAVTNVQQMNLAIVLSKASKYAKKLRPLEEFLPKDEFSVPVPEELQKRLAVNLSHFYVNYTLIVAVIVLITLIVYPTFFLLIMALCAIWYGLLSRPHHFSIDLTTVGMQGRIVQKTHMEYALAVFTVIFLFWTAGMNLVIFFGACILMVASHAAMRHVPKTSLGDEVSSTDGSQSNLVKDGSGDSEGPAMV
jgi:hypothetical protein